MIEINSVDKGNNGSSDSSLTRKEFIKKVVKGAAVTGGLVAAPAVLDKFLVPKAYAATSFFGSGCGKKNAGSPTQATGSPDIVATNGQNIHCGSTPGLTTGQSKQPDTACLGGGDLTLNCP